MKTNRQKKILEIVTGYDTRHRRIAKQLLHAGFDVTHNSIPRYTRNGMTKVSNSRGAYRCRTEQRSATDKYRKIITEAVIRAESTATSSLSDLPVWAGGDAAVTA